MTDQYCTKGARGRGGRTSEEVDASGKAAEADENRHGASRGASRPLNQFTRRRTDRRGAGRKT